MEEKNPYTTLTVAEQIAHIRQHQVEFDNTYGAEGEGRNVKEYFEEYGSVDREDAHGALYLNICADLAIDPKGLINRSES